MAINLKQDLLNQIGNEKYYEEIEFIRLAQAPDMYYKEKIDSMQNRLRNIAILNSEIALVGQYLQDAPPAPAVAPAQTKTQEPPVTPQPQVHAGQSHGEA